MPSWYVCAQRNGRTVNLPAPDGERQAHMIAGNLAVQRWQTQVKSTTTEQNPPQEFKPRPKGGRKSNAQRAAEKAATEHIDIPKATSLHYRKGMSFGEFQEMLAQRQAKS